MSDKGLVWLTLSAAYLIPPLGGSDFAIRPIYLFYAAVPLLHGKNQAANDLKFYLLFILSAIVSITWGSATLGVNITLSDYLEIIRILLPVPAFLFGFLFFNEFKSRFTKELMTLCFIIFSITLMQHFRVYHGFFTLIYSADSQLPAALGLETEYMRVVGVSGNPNDAGMLFFFIQLLFMSVWFERKQLTAALGWLAAAFCLTLTQSKTAYAAFVFSLIFLPIINGKFRFSLVATSLTVILYLMFASDVAYVNNFVTAVEGDGLFAARVFSIRFDNALNALNIWLESVVFGWGVAKSIHPSVVDVEYFLLLRRYGAAGILLLGAFIVSTMLKSAQLLKHHDENIRICANFICTATLSILIFMISNNFFSAYYNQFFYFMMLGIFAAARHTSSQYITQSA